MQIVAGTSYGAFDVPAEPGFVPIAVIETQNQRPASGVVQGHLSEDGRAWISSYSAVSYTVSSGVIFKVLYRSA